MSRNKYQKRQRISKDRLSTAGAARRRSRCLSSWAVALFFVGLSGCLPKSEREVVVYAALDREFSEPILDAYGEDNGVSVRPKYDVESTKTVGLVTAIINEQERPRCDVFWNNEMLHTMRLQRLGLLDVYHSPTAKDFPSDYLSPDGSWHGFAARARILIVNTDLIPELDQRPTKVEDLADPKWSGKVAMAKPSFGTTATHAAVLFDEWGETRAKEFLTQVAENAAILSGNKQVAIAVANGEYAFGITDTDDAIIEVERGAPVAIVFPDQGPGEDGTLFIPNSLCIIKNGPNPEEARKLVDHLLSAEVEIELANGSSAQFPVNPEVDVESRVQPSETIRWMNADFGSAAEEWDAASAFVAELFHRVN